MQHDSIAVVDFGGQYAHLIATKVRRHQVRAEILQPEDPIEAFKPFKGIILSGSPALSAKGEDSNYNKQIYDLDTPILGFCFGHQEIAKHYGGEVFHGKQEWGAAKLHVLRDHPLFNGLGKVEEVWMSHNDSVVGLGPDFEELGYTILGKGGAEHRYAAIASDKLRRYGFQYHPEVDDTKHGDEMIGNFVRGICECEPSWTMESYLEEQIESIKSEVGDRSVFLLASGGVDSTVAARLLGAALKPEQLHLLHVDHGLMRKDESKEVLSAFKDMGLDTNLHFVDASGEFLSALEGVIEPEKKRMIIGNTFLDVFDREARKLGLENDLLGQGTIYPDTVETGGTKRADTIKTHHNRVPLIEELIAVGKVVEPLVELYKVEVRELGEKLGVPSNMIWRHPFPGAGLGVRLLCSDGVVDISDSELERLSIAVQGTLAETELQSVTLPIRSVGVKADLRVYEHPVLLHGNASWSQLEQAAGRIFNQVKGVNRCIWNLTDSMPREFGILPATMTRERLDLLREVDHIVMQALERHNVYREVWQCPTVLVPLEIDGKGREFCIVRPVYSERAMSARPGRLSRELLDELRDAIMSFREVSGLAYDITSKPPGTIEWE